MDFALKYAVDGFFVFPVYEPVGVGVCSCGKEACKGKHPRTQNGCLDATTDEKTIREWWTKWPNASIGLATGRKSGLAVVDLDGMEGINSGKSLGLTSSVVALTGSGKQLFYADPEAKLRNSVKKLAPGIDTRGENGYVVVPPSLHPNGKRYTWLGASLKRSLLGSLPALLIRTENSAVSSTLRKPDGWIEESLARLREGHVANTLVSVLGKFKAHNFSEEATYQFLAPHTLVNGQPFEGLKDKIAEIWRRYPQSGAQNGTEDIDQFLEDQTKVEWICEPFIAKKSIGFVAGLPETCKTWMLMDLAVECARPSGSWLGKFTVSPSTILFIDQERFKGETQRRFSAILAAKGLRQADLKGRLFIKCGTTIRLNLEESFQSFRRELLDRKPDMVIVDSFATFHTAPENDRMEIQKVLNLIKQLRDEIGCAIVFVNHENKMAYPNGEPQSEPTAGTMSGSVGIPAAAEFVLTVRKVEAGTSMVWHTKSTLAQAAKPFYVAVKDVDNGIAVQGLHD